MTAQAAAAPVEEVPPIVLQIEAAQRRHRASFRTRFILTWAVILGVIGGFLGLTVGVNVGFLQEWLPFIIGGVWITLFISVVSIFFAVILAVFGALGRLSSNPYFNGVGVAVRLDRPRHAAHRPDPLHLPGACRRPGSSSPRCRPGSSPSRSTTAPT